MKKVIIKTSPYDGGCVTLDESGQWLDKSQLTEEEAAKVEAARVKFWQDNGPWPLPQGAKVVVTL